MKDEDIDQRHAAAYHVAGQAVWRSISGAQSMTKGLRLMSGGTAAYPFPSRTMLRRRNTSCCYAILPAGAQSTYGIEKGRVAMATLTKSFSPSLRIGGKAGTISMAMMRTPLTP
jgi:hypothetical protein